MGVILGIDAGSSAAKIAGLRPDGSVLATLRVRAEDQVTGLYGALGAFLYQNTLSLGDVERVALTGVGADFTEGGLFGLPTVRVSEFAAIGAGARALSGLKSAVVVSMGTGTAFLRVDGDQVEHLCGTGAGGGTLTGLCRALTGTGGFENVQELAAQGDLSKVNLMIRDVTRNPPPTLDPTLTASNFGRLSEDAEPADLAAGAVNLVLEVIGTMTVLACRCCGTNTAVFTGSVTAMPQAKANCETFERLYGLRCIIPENAAFATAIGAALCALRETGITPA